MTRLSVGISTCPNDTFAFHGLISGAVRAEGLELELVLGDVEQLNGRLLGGTLDAAKISYAAALRASERLVVLPVGTAIGFGVGPLVLGSRSRHQRQGRPKVVTPGALTTAALLWELFHGDEGEVSHLRFDQIPPALRAGHADLGVCIHEARFTWAEWQVDWVEDLGERWERETGAPLALGGIAARRDLGSDVIARLVDAVTRSLDHARAHPGDALWTMRANAQELDDRAIWQHVELYVTEQTRRLGPEGRRAVAELERRARALGLVPAGAPLEIFPG